MSAEKTEHQRRVIDFLAGIGHVIPATPQLAPRKVLCTWGRLLVEEVFEYLTAAGINVLLDDGDPDPLRFSELRFEIDDNVTPNLIGIVDACADISVVNTGAMVLNGISDVAVLAEVDANNVLKVTTGTMDSVTGKFKKAPNHPKPDFQSVLNAQGYISTGS